MSLDERTLIAKAQAGDREALGRLLMAHERACYALAYRLAHRPEDAEDICQDAFVWATRDVKDYRPTGRFRSWLFKLVAHAYGHRAESEEARRRREREKSMGQRTDHREEPVATEGSELKRQLDRALKRLGDSFRLPIVLHYEQGLTYAEAAEVLDMPEGTVATNIKRGIEELKGLMTAAGYACTVPVMTGALAEGLAVSVPAGLTAFIQSLTVAAEGGAAAVGKAAASISARISSRLAAKKAAGLALGWKVGTVLTAAAIGGAALVAVKSGMFDAKPAVTVAVAPEGTKPPPLPVSDYVQGSIIFEDNFDQGFGNWELLVGDDIRSLAPAGEEAAAILRTREGDYRLPFQGAAGSSPSKCAGITITIPSRTGDTRTTERNVVCLRSRKPITEEAFSIKWYVAGAMSEAYLAPPFPWARVLQEKVHTRLRQRLPSEHCIRWDCVPAGGEGGGTHLLEAYDHMWSPKYKGLNEEKLYTTRIIDCEDRRIGFALGSGEMKLLRVEVRRLEKRVPEGGVR